MLCFHQRPWLFTYLNWFERRPWELFQWGLIHALTFRRRWYILGCRDTVPMVFRLLQRRQLSLNHKTSVVHFRQFRHCLSIFRELRLSFCLIMCIFWGSLNSWLFCLLWFLILIEHPILVFTLIPTVVKITRKHILCLTCLHADRIIC
jgi:hypothetical protein